jgi:hypothetical protein
MRKPERHLTKKLTLTRETIRTLARAELAVVATGAAVAADGALIDSTDPCTGFRPLVVVSKAAPCA